MVLGEPGPILRHWNHLQFFSSNLPISSPNRSVFLQSSNTLPFIIQVSTDEPSFPNPTITHYPSIITTTINSSKPNQTKPNQPINQLTKRSINPTNPPTHQSTNQPIHQNNHQYPTHSTIIIHPPTIARSNDLFTLQPHGHQTSLSRDIPAN